MRNNFWAYVAGCLFGGMVVLGIGYSAYTFFSTIYGGPSCPTTCQ